MGIAKVICGSRLETVRVNSSNLAKSPQFVGGDPNPPTVKGGKQVYVYFIALSAVLR